MSKICWYICEYVLSMYYTYNKYNFKNIKTTKNKNKISKYKIDIGHRIMEK